MFVVCQLSFLRLFYACLCVCSNSKSIYNYTLGSGSSIAIFALIISLRMIVVLSFKSLFDM